MAKRTDNSITKQFTARIHKQHSSLVITVPKGLCEILNLSRKDIILFEVDEGESAAIVGKLISRGLVRGRNKGNSDKGDNSR